MGTSKDTSCSNPNASSFWNNSCDLRASIANIPQTYNFVYFNPSNNSFSGTSGKCFASSKTGDTYSAFQETLNMKQFGPLLHTPESCKFNAGTIKSYFAWDEYTNPETNYFSPTSITDTPINQQAGLTFTIYDGYHLNSDLGFANVKKNKITRVTPNTGVTTNMTNLTTALNGIIEAQGRAGGWCNNVGTSQHTFTVEWFGYFLAPTTGPFKFEISSDDGSYLWLGDNAMDGQSTLSNCFIDNGGLHGVKSESQYTNAGNTNTLQSGLNIANVTAETYYPIRIRFGENCGGYDLQLRIYDINNNNAMYSKNGDHGKTIFYTSASYNYNPGALTQRDVFYSLVENTPEDTAKNLFKCYITTNTNPIFFKQYTDPAVTNTGPVILWSAITNVYIPKTSTHAKISEDNLTFGLYDVNETLIYTIVTSTTKSTTVKLSDNGDFIFGSATISIGDKGNSQVNKYWQDQYNKYIASSPPQDFSILTYPQTLSRQTSSTTSDNLSEWNYTRYSSNGKYALLIDTTGNLIVIGNEDVCTNKTKDGKTIYTKSSVANNFYTYKAVADPKLNKLFLVNNDSKQLTNISLSSNLAKLGNSYSEYDGYLSLNTNKSTKKDEPACKSSCDNDPSCKYYYTYKDSQSNNYCLLSNNDAPFNNIISSQTVFPMFPSESINQIMQDESITSSKLFVKNIVNADTNTPYINIIPQMATSDTKKYNQPHYNVVKDSGDENSMDNALKGIYGNISKQASMFDGFENREPFDNHGYQNELNGYNSNPSSNVISNDQNAIYSRKDILNKELNPLLEQANDYQDLMDTVNTNYQNIDTSISNTVNLRNSMIRDAAYDFDGSKLDFIDKRKGIMDAVIDDSSQMVYSQNSNYILGTMTVATILIIAIMISRD